MQNDMKIKLSDRGWNQFKLATIFKIENCKCSKVSGLQKGSIPYVGATNRNNGVMNFVKADKKLITKGNCIAFICDGEGSVGYSIYKSEDFIGSTTVKVGRNTQLNKYNATFITTIADTVRSKYNFGFKRNATHLKNEILMLPVNEKGEPDFKFMEAFMLQTEQEKFEQYKNYISQRFKELKDFKSVEPIEEKEWSEFFLKDIFTEIQRGKRLKKADHKKGKMPYVSSTGLNNGVDGNVGNIEKVRIFSDCLTIANSGSVGACFYQPFEFVASDHVTQLKNEDFNPYTYKFISSIVRRLGVKYSFNREMNDTRIKKEKILLPINDQNEPDYEYMENYIKQLEHKKLNEYLTTK